MTPDERAALDRIERLVAIKGEHPDFRIRYGTDWAHDWHVAVDAAGYKQQPPAPVTSHLRYALQHAASHAIDAAETKAHPMERARGDLGTFFYDWHGTIDTLLYRGLYVGAGLPVRRCWLPGFWSPNRDWITRAVVGERVDVATRGGGWTEAIVYYPDLMPLIESLRWDSSMDRSRMACMADPRLPIEERIRQAMTSDERAYLEGVAEAERGAKKAAHLASIAEENKQRAAARDAAEFASSIGGATVLFRRGGWMSSAGRTIPPAFIWPADRTLHADYLARPEADPNKLYPVKDPPPMPVMEFFNRGTTTWGQYGRHGDAWVLVPAYGGTPVVFDADGVKIPHSKRRNEILKAIGWVKK